MTNPRTSVAYLRDILDACEKAERFVAGMSFENFADDEKTIFAVVHALEVIGEAAKRVAPSVRAAHPQVPWREMAGMRDKLVHDYFGVNPVVVWKTVGEDMPLLKSLVASVLEAQERSKQ